MKTPECNCVQQRTFLANTHLQKDKNSSLSSYFGITNEYLLTIYMQLHYVSCASERQLEAPFWNACLLIQLSPIKDIRLSDKIPCNANLVIRIKFIRFVLEVLEVLTSLLGSSSYNCYFAELSSRMYQSIAGIHLNKSIEDLLIKGHR